MRLFNLFLRRAGVQSAAVVARGPMAVSRLTVECPRHVLPELRREIYHSFEAAGLHVAALRIDRGASQGMARACVTINYAPESRRELMSQARHIGRMPGVQNVQWGGRAQARPQGAIALN